MVDPNSRSDPKLQELMKVRRDEERFWKNSHPTPQPLKVSTDRLFCEDTIQGTLQGGHSHIKVLKGT